MGTTYKHIFEMVVLLQKGRTNIRCLEITHINVVMIIILLLIFVDYITNVTFDIVVVVVVLVANIIVIDVSFYYSTTIPSHSNKVIPHPMKESNRCQIGGVKSTCRRICSNWCINRERKWYFISFHCAFSHPQTHTDDVEVFFKAFAK